MSVFVKAAAHALIDQPAVNAGKNTQTSPLSHTQAANFTD